jgi:hypothetical protein
VKNKDNGDNKVMRNKIQLCFIVHEISTMCRRGQGKLNYDASLQSPGDILEQDAAITIVTLTFDLNLAHGCCQDEMG